MSRSRKRRRLPPESQSILVQMTEEERKTGK
jgi:hypothetical protein